MVLLIAEMIYFSASISVFSLSGGLMKDFRNIDWTAEKISRLWEYYGSNRAYDNAHFSRHTGNRILSHIRRCIDLTKKQILDFSDESIIQAKQRLAGSMGYWIKRRFDSQGTPLSAFNLHWPQEVKYEKIFI